MRCGSAGQRRQVHGVQRRGALAIAVGELEIPLPLAVLQFICAVRHFATEQRNAVFAQHAQAHGEGFTVEVLRHLPLEAPRRGTFNVVGDPHDLGKAAFLSIGRGSRRLARQVLHEQHRSGLEQAGAAEEVGEGNTGEAVSLVTGQRQVEHRHLGSKQAGTIAIFGAGCWTCGPAVQRLTRLSVSLGNSLNNCR